MFKETNKPIWSHPVQNVYMAKWIIPNHSKPYYELVSSETEPVTGGWIYEAN